VVALQWISGFRVAFRKCSGRSFECGHILMLFIALHLQDPFTESIHRTCVTLRVLSCSVFKSIFSFDVTGTWLYQKSPISPKIKNITKHSQTPQTISTSMKSYWICCNKLKDEKRVRSRALCFPSLSPHLNTSANPTQCSNRNDIDTPACEACEHNRCKSCMAVDYLQPYIRPPSPVNQSEFF
jgi:hypothetical protein